MENFVCMHTFSFAEFFKMTEKLFLHLQVMCKTPIYTQKQIDSRFSEQMSHFLETRDILSVVHFKKSFLASVLVKIGKILCSASSEVIF